MGKRDKATRGTFEEGSVQDRRLFSTAEVCEVLNMGINTIRDHIKKGYLKGRRAPRGAYRFTLSDIDNYLQRLGENR